MFENKTAFGSCILLWNSKPNAGTEKEQFCVQWELYYKLGVSQPNQCVIFQVRGICKWNGWHKDTATISFQNTEHSSEERPAWNSESRAGKLCLLFLCSSPWIFLTRRAPLLTSLCAQTLSFRQIRRRSQSPWRSAQPPSHDSQCCEKKKNTLTLALCVCKNITKKPWQHMIGRWWFGVCNGALYRYNMQIWQM